jgi:hypothetical protein
MKTNASVYAAIVLAACAAACGESEPSKTGESAATAPGTGTPAAMTPASPSTPAGAAGAASPSTPSNPGSVPVGSKPAMNPQQPTTPVTPGNTPQNPDQPAVPMMGAGGARFPDACSERRASWGKPCSTNPDPCNLKSGFPGDEYCLLPPPEGKGIQIHFGPKDYKNMAEVSKYVINPGEEFNSYAVANVPDFGDQPRYFQYMKVSMRPGSHHLINNLISGKPAEGFVAGRGGCEGTSMGSFPGTQNLVTESPPQGIPAPENVGLGRTLPPNISICQNYHRYNTTDKPALSEIWYNIWWIDEKDITQKTSGVTINAPVVAIAPGEQQVITTTSTTQGDGRIVTLFGHRHAHTERFAAWLNDKLIYDSWDWVESRVFNYDSITTNPAPDPPNKIDGAVSGVLDFKKGDKIKIECHVNNTSDVTLRFANELNTGEMCILFGSTVGSSIGGGF